MTDQTETAGAEIRHGHKNPRNLYSGPTTADHFAVIVGDLGHAEDLAGWLADAARAHIAAGHPMPQPVKADTFELLDAAAERGHNAMFEGDLPAEGIERELWHKVVLAVLDDPQLLPHWARAARVDAETWRRQCSTLDGELEKLRTALGVERGALFVLDQLREQLNVSSGPVAGRITEIVAERDGLSTKVGETVRILREAGVHHGEGLAERVRNLIAERDQLKTRIDRMGFEIENWTLPVGALRKMSDAVNLVHPVSEEDDDVPYVELRARRAMEVVYDWLREIRAIPAALHGDQAAEPDKTWCPRCYKDATDDRYTQESSDLWRCRACHAVLVVPDPPLQSAEPTSPSASPSAVDSGEEVAKSCDPNGCRHCGASERGHYRRYTDGVGWHQWTAPDDATRLERMLARRAASTPAQPPAPFVPAADAFSEEQS